MAPAPEEPVDEGRATRTEVTRMLSLVDAGAQSVEALLPLVYAELRSTANRLMRAERGNHTLEPTALVHEAFVKLVDGEASLGSGRRHFLAIAARAMRNLLVDHARERQAQKRGGGQAPVTLSGVAADGGVDVDLLDLHEALGQLEQLDERQARVIEMSYFSGMTGDEIAEELGVHRNTVVSEMRMARTWLQRQLKR